MVLDVISGFQLDFTVKYDDNKFNIGFWVTFLCHFKIQRDINNLHLEFTWHLHPHNLEMILILGLKFFPIKKTPVQVMDVSVIKYA